MFNINDIKKQPEGVVFEKKLSIEETVKARNPEVLALEDVIAKGKVSYDGGLYLLNYDLTYTISLPSSRSLETVKEKKSLFINEVFIEASQMEAKKDLVDEDLVLILEDDVIDLEESVIDNILLNIPLQILTEEEKQDQQLPSGQDWNLLSEEQYKKLQKEKQEENSPFAALDGLFDEE